MESQKDAILPKPTNTLHARQSSGGPSCSPQVGTGRLSPPTLARRRWPSVASYHLRLRQVPWLWLSRNLN